LPSRVRILVSSGLLALTVAVAESVPAGPLYQPDATLIPAGPSLQQIFAALGEPIDAVLDAQVSPQAFPPVYSSVSTVLARSSPYNSAFGWYNDFGSKPDWPELHEIFNGGDPAGSQHAHDFRNDPYYYGGDIGFVEGVGRNADLGDSSTILDVGTEKLLIFTDPDYSPGGEEPDRFIHVLIYASKLDWTKYYFAFEDSLEGDNDFDDLVISATGLATSAGVVAPAAAAQRLSLSVRPSIFRLGEGVADVVPGLPPARRGTLDVMDLAGRRVRTLCRGISGLDLVSWDGRDDAGRPVNAGLYLLRLRSGSQTAVQRVVVFR